MKDDGARLSIIIDYDKVNVFNNLDGTMYIKSKADSVTASTLDKEIINTHLETMQQLLMQHKLSFFGYKPFAKGTNKSGVSIVEKSHYNYQIIVDGKCAELTEFGLRGQFLFNVDALIESINFARDFIRIDDKVLRPKYDIVRRISDADLLVWVYDRHTAVCNVNNIYGQVMLKCLVDNDYYDYILVSVDKEADRCSLFDSDFNLLIEFPLDKSILTYFADDLEDF